MARTPSTMLELGSQAKDFSLPEPLTGKTVSLSDFAGKPVLLMFTCNHCPFVLHILDGFTTFADEYKARGLEIIAISSNDVDVYPADSPEKMAELARELSFNFPYLYDESQQVALAYEAACTPDFFLYDAAGKLVYRGQFDGSRPGNDVPVNGEDMRVAADAMLAGSNIPADQKPSLGCNIKWKSGNAPAYSS